jgi:hypothetical protein
MLMEEYRAKVKQTILNKNGEELRWYGIRAK